MPEITDLDLAEIIRLIKEGNTSGILDADSCRIAWNLSKDSKDRRASWNLNIEKLKN